MEKKGDPTMDTDKRVFVIRFFRILGIFLLVAGGLSMLGAWYFGPGSIMDAVLRMAAVGFFTFGLVLTIFPETGGVLVKAAKFLSTASPDVFYKH